MFSYIHVIDGKQRYVYPCFSEISDIFNVNLQRRTSAHFLCELKCNEFGTQIFAQKTRNKYYLNFEMQ